MGKPLKLAFFLIFFATCLQASELEAARIETQSYIDNRLKSLQKHAPKLAKMLRQTFLNPIVTATQQNSDGSIYVITGGDGVPPPPMINGTQVAECWFTNNCPEGTMLNSMWLRDAFGMFMPYFAMIEDSAAYPNIRAVYKGLLYTAAMQIGHSQYANAFRPDFEFSSDNAAQGDFGIVSQNTYEPDSLMWVAWGAWRFAKILHDEGTEVLNLFGRMDDLFVLEKIYGTLKTETYRWAMQKPPPDRFLQQQCPRDHLSQACSQLDIEACTDAGSPCRWIFDPTDKTQYCTNDNYQASYQQWAMGGQGLGQPVYNLDCGDVDCALTYSPYRPSDDLTKYGYNIPHNMMVVATMDRLSDLARWIAKNLPQFQHRAAALSASAQELRAQIQAGIEQYGTVTLDNYREPQGNAIRHAVQKFGDFYLYETDGRNGAATMDDANIPSLLSMNYFGYGPNITLWENTYQFVTSSSNPYFISDSDSSNPSLSGIGSCHTNAGGDRNKMVWPMATILQAQVESNRNSTRAAELLHQVVHATSDTFFMHESVSAGYPGDFTRGWFAWANGLFAEIVDEWVAHDEKQNGVIKAYLEFQDP